jgi:DNA-binding NtrC family response regulator/tetratricopeptide (TPR) repeat protein
MNHSETEETVRDGAAEPLATLRADIEASIERAAWDEADALLGEHLSRDAEGDVQVLSLFRALEEGRGTRARLVARVDAFVARYPARVSDPYVRLERGLALRATGDNDAAREELLAARDAFRQMDGSHLPALVLAENGVGLTYLAPLDAERAKRAFRAARTLAEQAGIFDRVAVADLNLAYVELESGDLEKAARAYRAALAACERAGDERGIVRASYNLGNCLHDLGRDRAARKHLVRARELAIARKEPWYTAWPTLILGDLARKAERYDEAEQLYDEVEAIFTQLGGPSPTERAWVEMRRAEIALDRGQPKLASRLARAAIDPRVEPTPRVYGRLIRAVARMKVAAKPSVAKELEAIADEAEALGLTEVAWRARVNAAKARVELVARRRMRGVRSKRADGTSRAARAHVARALALLEHSLGAMGPSGRRHFVSDHARKDDAAWLFAAEALAEADPRSTAVVAGSMSVRSAWLRLLDRVGAVAAAERPQDVASRALDAIVEIAGAERGYLWIDERAGEPPLHVGRDVDRRDLPPRERPLLESRVGEDTQGGGTVRPLRHREAVVGALVLDAGSAAFADESLDLVDALASVAYILVAAARVREKLVLRSEEREEAARSLAIELARTEAALGEARDKLEDLEGERRADRRGRMVGRSRAMRDLFARLDRLQRSELPVLITGESGTGKELVARAIHDESARSAGPFVAINCGALAEPLLESELFGHVRGAFTGADRDAPGLFVVAHRGTLLLDEVGEMSLGMQAKLLRVLQEGEVRPVGGGKTRKVDVRVIAATHRNLEELVATGRFREDLYYRLHVLSAFVPPLRAREDDVLLLARHFLENVAPDKRLGPDAAAWLLAQAWPGNVRELRAVIQSAAVLCDGPVIGQESLHPRSAGGTGTRPPRRDEGVPERLEELEAWAIERALERFGGSRVKAAKSLGIGRATLYRKLAMYGIAAR